MPKNYAIILAGGSGSRMGQTIPKQLLPLGKQTIIECTVLAFISHPEIEAVTVVCPAEYINEIQHLMNRHQTDKKIKTVPGGITRRDSSWRGITSMDFNEDDILLIHDAARPFIDNETIDKCIKAATRHGAAGTYVKAIDTITEIKKDRVTSIPPRNTLYYAQTPQSFRFSIIRASHENARLKNIEATDDVSLVLDAGYKVIKVDGSYRNIKITTIEDYDYACNMAEKPM